MKNVLTWALLAAAGLGACTKEMPPPSVEQFMTDSVLLDATMVRCSANRASTKYEPECVNAREAINRIARAEEESRREELEKQSERKRRALRRTQQAAAAARQRAEDAARRREEEAYLAQFESLPPEADAPPAANVEPSGSEVTTESAPTPSAETAPVPDPAPAADSGSRLGDIREELRRRQEDGQ